MAPLTVRIGSSVRTFLCNPATSTLRDIYTFAIDSGPDDVKLFFIGHLIPKDSLELWSAYSRRMGSSDSTILGVLIPSAAPAPVPVVLVGFTVFAIDGKIMHRHENISLSLGRNSGTTIHFAFNKHFNNLYNIMSVGLRNPDVASVVLVEDTYNLYDVGELSHLFIVVHPKSTRTGGRRRAKHTAERSLSRSYRR